MKVPTNLRTTQNSLLLPLIALLLLVVLGCEPKLTNARIEVVDATGHKILLENGAKRLIGLSPQSVENIYSAGAGDLLVARSAYADFPAEAQDLPIVSEYNKINLEQILTLKPDLIIAWQSGTPDDMIKKIQALGIPIYLSEANQLEDIAKTIQDIGHLTHRNNIAQQAAARYLSKLKTLRSQYSTPSGSPQHVVNVFYQIWNKPLYTIGGQQTISEVIELCGGKNIFAEQTIKAPIVSAEAVIARNPMVIISGNKLAETESLKQQWREWSQIEAVKYDNFFVVHPDEISRSTPRILLAAKTVCTDLKKARSKLLPSK